MDFCPRTLLKMKPLSHSLQHVKLFISSYISAIHYNEHIELILILKWILFFFLLSESCLTKFILTLFLTILPPKFSQLPSIITSLQIIFRCLHQFNLYFSSSDNESWPPLHTENGVRKKKVWSVWGFRDLTGVLLFNSWLYVPPQRTTTLIHRIFHIPWCEYSHHTWC